MVFANSKNQVKAQFFPLVGDVGFELTASCSQNKRATPAPIPDVLLYY